MDIEQPVALVECHFEQKDGMTAHVTLRTGGGEKTVSGKGNGRLDAVYEALGDILPPGFVVEHYTEHAIGTGSDSKACAYIGLSDAYGTLIWGVGTDDDIITASLHALVSAVNRARRHG